MCLGVPMQVVSIEGDLAQCTAKGVQRQVSLFLLRDDPPATGEFVMVHVGYALQKMTPHDARSTWELFDRILETETAPDHA